MSSVKITVMPSGPVVVEGPIEIVGADGQPIAVPGPRIKLCRCGQSKNKPFCDGNHRMCGFTDPPKP